MQGAKLLRIHYSSNLYYATCMFMEFAIRRGRVLVIWREFYLASFACAIIIGMLVLVYVLSLVHTAWLARKLMLRRSMFNS